VVLGAGGAVLVDADANLVAIDESALIPLPRGVDDAIVGVGGASLDFGEFGLNDIGREVEGLESGKTLLGQSDGVGDGSLNLSPAFRASNEVDGTSTLVEDRDFSVDSSAVDDVLAGDGGGHFI